jgi:hypothetical protein
MQQERSGFTLGKCENVVGAELAEGETLALRLGLLFLYAVDALLSVFGFGGDDAHIPCQFLAEVALG